MHWLRVANEIVHDLSAGAWPGAAAASWLIRTRAEAALPPGTLTPAVPAWSSVFLVMLASLAALVVTGVIRANYRGVTARTRTRIVLVKHAVFVLVFVLATVVAVAALSA